MIYVDRYGVDEDGKAIKPNDSWFDRAAEATVNAIAEKRAHEPDAATYAHTEVRKALERLFPDKCAYCEAKMTATSDWDVEHFRPKGRVAEREDHPGYYWLTYWWENLYPSCTHCNQRRKDRPRWADATELPAAGKRDQFPLLDESTRAMGPEDDVYEEHTLLIDPCFDDPEDYLGYDQMGQVFSLDENPYGEKTIEVMHLNRRRLKDPRQETVKAVTTVLKMLSMAEGTGNQALFEELQTVVANLQAGDREYAGLARYVTSRSAEFGV